MKPKLGLGLLVQSRRTETHVGVSEGHLIGVLIIRASYYLQVLFSGPPIFVDPHIHGKTKQALNITKHARAVSSNTPLAKKTQSWT